MRSIFFFNVPYQNGLLSWDQNIIMALVSPFIRSLFQGLDPCPLPPPPLFLISHHLISDSYPSLFLNNFLLSFLNFPSLSTRFVWIENEFLGKTIQPRSIFAKTGRSLKEFSVSSKQNQLSWIIYSIGFTIQEKRIPWCQKMDSQ